MRKILTSVLITLTAFASRQVLAQTGEKGALGSTQEKASDSGHLQISQSGKNNRVNVSQNSDSTTTVTIIRDSNGNTQTIKRPTTPGDHHLKIEQTGNNNRAVVRQSAGTGNSARIRQSSTPENK